jgi:hypothetical protein
MQETEPGTVEAKVRQSVKMEPEEESGMAALREQAVAEEMPMEPIITA